MTHRQIPAVEFRRRLTAVLLIESEVTPIGTIKIVPIVPVRGRGHHDNPDNPLTLTGVHLEIQQGPSRTAPPWGREGKI